MRFPNRYIGGVAAILAILVTPSAHAHEMWIRPSKLHAKAGELVEVGLRVGPIEDGGEPVLRDGRWLERFVLLGPGLSDPELSGSRNESPILGLDGRDPAGWIRPTRPGRYVIALRSHETVNELPAARFEGYLAEEGMDEVIAERARRGESDRPGRERFSRALKALLTVSSGEPAHGSRAGLPDGPADRPVGLRLELIALDDPLRLGAGDPLHVELRFEGRPLEGALIRAFPLPVSGEGTRAALAVRSDAEGHATFVLPAGGAWLLSTVHMVPAPPDVEETWQSVWTALTFFLGTE